jgi:transcriptional regulator with GAF, ATPase, and Fis domain
MNILMENGADLLQGYLFSKPVPPDEIEDKLDRFFKSDPAFDMFQKQRIDMKALLGNENDNELSPALYKLLIKCVYILFAQTDLAASVEKVLELIGSQMNVSRTYIFLRDTDNFFTNTYEWCENGISSQKSGQIRIEMSDGFIETLKTRGILDAPDISELPGDLYRSLHEQNVHSVLLIPLWNGDELLGFMGYDECVRSRHWWWPEEILTLHNLSLILAGILRVNDCGG